MKKVFVIIITMAFLNSCKEKKAAYDASGTFEAVETIISAEASGVIKELNIEEGQSLKTGDTIGYIDPTQLILKKKQLQAQSKAVLSKKPDISSQLASLQERLKQAEHEQQRISNMVKADVATPKQLDDANAEVAVIKKEISAKQTSLGITSSSITEETLPIDVQVEQVDDQLSKTKIINKVNGTVLTKYAEVNEMAVAGKPLYKIADLSTIILRAYITGDQFAKVKLNQNLKVMVDDGTGKYKEYNGTVTWINNKAEFTPKTIQTKDERANLVYAVKISVRNDGYLKIGMYGEVKL
ncbi:MAG: HlyD family efflux transporter periplasmic adaptor subunit [Ferruginibacter sp.]